MKNEPSWLLELVSVVRASTECRELPTAEVAFVASGKTFGVTLPNAHITSGERATAWIEGSDATFEELVAGSLTPQKAFVTDLLSLYGDSEVLLRVTGLFEHCFQSRRT